MLTDQQADLIYQKARDALSQTIRALDGVTDEQRELARQKREQLNLEFIGQAIARIEARTAKFRQFIEEMQVVIDQFDPSASIAGILQLTAVVDEAAGLVKAATQPRAAAEAGAGLERGAVRGLTPAAGRAPKPKRTAAKTKRSAKPVVRARAKSPASRAAKKKTPSKTPTAKKPAASKPAGKKVPPKRRAARKPSPRKARPS